MSTLHQHIIIADDSLATSMSGTVHHYILTENIIVADNAFRLLAMKLEILRQGTNYRTLMHFIIVSHACTITDTDEGEDNAIVANHHVTLYIDKGEYLTIVADFRSWIDFGLWTYFACHNYQLSIINYQLLSASAKGSI
jgi:hypothetical protein